MIFDFDNFTFHLRLKYFLGFFNKCSPPSPMVSLDKFLDISGYLLRKTNIGVYTILSASNLDLRRASSI